MKQKPGWVLPDLKEAQKRTTNTIDRIDTFNIPIRCKHLYRYLLPLLFPPCLIIYTQIIAITK